MATIYLYGDVGTDITTKSVNDQLSQIKNKTDDLTVYIDSMGGTVATGLAIINLLKRWKGKTTAVVDGIAASIASVIAVSMNKTYITIDSMMFIHDPYITTKLTGETASTIAKEQTKPLLDLKQRLLDMYKSKTNIPALKLSKMMSEETVLTADECVKLKFADKIVKGSDVQAKLSTRDFNNSLLNESAILKISSAIKAQATIKGINTMDEKEVTKEEESAEAKIDTSLDLTTLTPEEVLAYAQAAQTYIDELEMKIAEQEDAPVEEAKKEVDESAVKAALINELFVDELIGRAQAKVLNTKSLAFVQAHADKVRLSPKKERLVIDEPIANLANAKTIPMAAKDWDLFVQKNKFEPKGYHKLS